MKTVLQLLKQKLLNDQEKLPIYNEYINGILYHIDNQLLEVEKQQQERSYSEEEVLNIIDNYNETFKVDLILREDFNQWFEQFKNK